MPRQKEVIRLSVSDHKLAFAQAYVQLSLPPATGPATPAADGSDHTATRSTRTRRTRSDTTVALSLNALGSVIHGHTGADEIKAEDLAGWRTLTRKEQQQVRELVLHEQPPQQPPATKISTNGTDASDATDADVGGALGPAMRTGNKKQKVTAANTTTPSETTPSSAAKGKPGKPPLGRAGKGVVSESEGSNVETEGIDDEDEFERRRQERIERNQRYMAKLALEEAAEQVADISPGPARLHGSSGGGVRAKEKGLSGQKRSAPSEPSERRMSLRVRGVRADPVLAAGVETEGARGGVVLAAKAGVKSIWTVNVDGSGSTGQDTGAAVVPDDYERHPTGSLKFESENGTDASDAAFLQYLKLRLSGIHKSESKSDVKSEIKAEIKSEVDANESKSVTVTSVTKLQLQEGDVAKMTKKGTSCMAWHPSEGDLLLAAADKEGRIALWQVDYQAQDGDQFDGVACFDHVHKEYVSALTWASLPGSSVSATNHLLTASYDGSVRILDVHQERFLDYSKGIPKLMEISAMDYDCHKGVAYIGDNQGSIQIMDLKSGEPVRPGIITHLKRVNCIHLEPVHGNLMVTAGSDAVVRIWDVRMLGPPVHSKVPPVKPVQEMVHSNSCHAAYFAPDGSQRVVSTSFDDTVRVWSASSSEGKTVDPDTTSHTFKHDNQTGRWVTPFRAVWGAKGDFVAIGSMKRGIDVFDTTTSKMVVNNKTSDFMTAIPSRLAAHPCMPVLAAATSSGRVHIWR